PAVSHSLRFPRWRVLPLHTAHVAPPAPVLSPPPPRPPQHLHSFPTRRSSDLKRQHDLARVWSLFFHQQLFPLYLFDPAPLLNKRSEEHTSELQSRFDLVCRLLLEKKKNHHKIRSHLET